MFGQNSISKKDHGDGIYLHVVKGSPFHTVQGEGPYAGHSAVFIRLHGCHLRCVFCDTNFDDHDDPVVHIYDLRRKALEIRRMARLVVVTGGEPMRQNIYPLCSSLKEAGFKVQIETAGTFWVDGIETCAEIVCSPKTPTIHPKIFKYAVAFKYVINGEQYFGLSKSTIPDFVPTTATQPGSRPAKLAMPPPDTPVYLSPMDVGNETVNALNRKLVGYLAMMHGVIAGVQLHKFMELD